MTIARDINTALLDSLQEGLLSFAPPSTMTTGRLYPVSARVARKRVEQKITEVFHAASGVPQLQEIKVGPDMRAQLELEDDSIYLSYFGDEQLVGESDYTEVYWEVTPRTWGKKRLLLTVSAALVDTGVGPRYWLFPVLEREIDVQVDPMYVAGSFVGEYQFLLAIGLVLIVSLGWYLWNRRKRETKRKVDVPATLQLAPLQAALLSAFTSKTKLQQMVRIQMGENLDAIASGDLSDITFDLIIWADEQGRLDDLIMGAYRTNAGNAKLKAFVKEYFGRLPEIEGQKP